MKKMKEDLLTEQMTEFVDVMEGNVKKMDNLGNKVDKMIKTIDDIVKEHCPVFNTTDWHLSEENLEDAKQMTMEEAKECTKNSAQMKIIKEVKQLLIGRVKELNKELNTYNGKVAEEVNVLYGAIEELMRIGNLTEEDVC